MNKNSHTFADIFSLQIKNGESINGIEIPMIQRDYAQGRDTPEINRVRNAFLQTLYDAFAGESEPVKLDFIYGDVIDGLLIPLDGQQRLTTLFLIHWYVAKKEVVPTEDSLFLHKFTYKTRPSSTRFCEKLQEITPDFSTKQLSTWLRNQSWYLLSWEHDPTIASMLVMLDAIHDYFGNTSGLWPKLIAADNPPVSFYFLALDDMGLTDSLYIKMNSRGKPLTDFEHFKAEFEGMVYEVSKPLYEEIIHKTDKDWVDMLWRYRGEDNAIDDEFMRYFRYVSEMLCYRCGNNICEDIFDLADSLYSKKNCRAEEHIQFVIRAFDCWCCISDIDAFFNDIFSKTDYTAGKTVLYSDKTNVFLECCNSYGKRWGSRREFTLNNAILLYAVLIYQINNESIPSDEFRTRIRIVRNLILKSEFEIRADMERMKAILNDVDVIILQGKVPVGTKAFNELQKKQEIEKVQWRSQHPQLASTLDRLEDHPLLQGSTAVIGFDEPDKFKERVDAFYAVFNQATDYISVSRALLTIQDYSQEHSWRLLLADRNDASWRFLFTESEQRKHFDRTRSAVKALLDRISSRPNLTVETLINEYLSRKDLIFDWKYYLIKYPEMRSGDHGRYYRRDGETYNFVMMNTASSLSGRHWTPYFKQVMTDPEIRAKCSLDDYGAPLVINAAQMKIHCLNDSWKITDMENNDIRVEPIPQDSYGVDSVDRVEHLLVLINAEIQKQI